MTGVFPRSNYVVTARYSIRPESAGRMRVLAHDLTTMARADKGCILYHFSESAEKEGTYSLLMIWKDGEAYQRYISSPFVRAFNSNLAQGMLAEPVLEEIWRSLG